MQILINFKSRMLMTMLAFFVYMSASADNYPVIELDEPFVVKDFDLETVWMFTAPKSGIATIAGATDNDFYGPCLEVYADANMKGGNISSFQFNPSRDEFVVTEGQTYYIKNNNWQGMDINAKITMDLTGDGSFKFTGAEPAEGGMYSATANETVFLHFNTANVTFDRGEITTPNGHLCGVYKYEDWNELAQEGIVEVTQDGMSGVENWKGNLFGRTENGIAISFTTHTGSGFYNPVLRLYEEGLLKVNDPITLTLQGVTSILTGEKLNGTGDFKITWKFAGAPTTLISNEMPTVIKSWFNEGDPEAIATYTFSRDIRSAKASLEMGQGEGADDLYTEEIADNKIIIDGATVKVDLSGVMRTNKIMGLKYNWPSFTLKLYSVVDTDGNGTYSSDLGSASSYSSEIGYQNISTEISSDFTPQSGTTLTEATKEIEIWFNNSNIINWDGVNFTYYTTEQIEETDNEGTTVITEQNVAHDTFIPKANLTVEEEDNETTILVPVPADLYKTNNIRLGVNVIGSVDGTEHVIAAYYNTTLSHDLDLVRYAEPANESTVSVLKEVYLTIGSTYAINNKVASPVKVYGKTTGKTLSGTIEPDGMTNAKIVLSETLTDADTYAIEIAEGVIGDYIYGESNYQTGITNGPCTLTYTVDGKYAGKSIIIDPEEGEVNSLNKFTLTFFDYNAVNPTWDNDALPYIKDTEDVKIYGQFQEKTMDDIANAVTIVFENPITAVGDYALVLPSGAVCNGATGDPIENEYSFHYVICSNTAISKFVIEQGGKADIYNANGQLIKKAATASVVNTLTPGLYIINGKRVILK